MQFIGYHYKSSPPYFSTSDIQIPRSSRLLAGGNEKSGFVLEQQFSEAIYICFEKKKNNFKKDDFIMNDSSTQQELISRIRQKQMEGFMRIYSNMVHQCFDNCVNDFASSKLQSTEESCVMRCVDKSIKANERLLWGFKDRDIPVVCAGLPWGPYKGHL